LTTRLKRKSGDTRELVFYLEEPGRTDPHPVLWGAAVTITIWHPTGHVVKRDAECTVSDLDSGKVTYMPEVTDFDDLGVYSLQWRAVYPDGTDARFPSDKTFGRVDVFEALDSRT
jgi:hypothetical protein